MAYDEAHDYFVNNEDMDFEEVKDMEANQSGLSKILCCIPKPKLASDTLKHQYNEIFAIAKVKYDS